MCLVSAQLKKQKQKQKTSQQNKKKKIHTHTHKKTNSKEKPGPRQRFKIKTFWRIFKNKNKKIHLLKQYGILFSLKNRISTFKC